MMEPLGFYKTRDPRYAGPIKHNPTCGCCGEEVGRLSYDLGWTRACVSCMSKMMIDDETYTCEVCGETRSDVDGYDVPGTGLVCEDCLHEMEEWAW